MGSKNTEYDWLNDPFDEQKEAEDMIRAQKARNKGCLLSLLIIVVLIIVFAIAGFALFLAPLAGSGL